MIVRAGVQEHIQTDERSTAAAQHTQHSTHTHTCPGTTIIWSERLMLCRGGKGRHLQRRLAFSRRSMPRGDQLDQLPRLLHHKLDPMAKHSKIDGKSRQSREQGNREQPRLVLCAAAALLGRRVQKRDTGLDHRPWKHS